MLNDDESNEMMMVIEGFEECCPQSILLRHLTSLHKERDVQFYWNLRDLSYWAKDDKTHNLILRMH